MKIMACHTSATAREETPHPTETTRTATIINALKRRALAVLNDKSIDARSRAIIRYGLETNDPWLAELVRRAGAGESIADTFDFSQTPETNENDSNQENFPPKKTAQTEIKTSHAPTYSFPGPKQVSFCVLYTRLHDDIDLNDPSEILIDSGPRQE
jgi:hypothetical protein